MKWLLNGRNRKLLPANYRKHIDRDALDIVKNLKEAGHESYLVGGCVRDLMLGLSPKDFDISTSATPEQVKRKVRRCFVIGRRFRIVLAKRRKRSSELLTNLKESKSLFPHMHGYLEEREYQITTFRRDPVEVDGKLNENVYGSAREDAYRRDFSLNALFLDPETGQVVDFVGGLEDLKKRQLRLIGDPEHRFREDPVRLFRALRFMTRVDLKLETKTGIAFEKCAHLIGEAKAERLREEVLKIFREGATDKALGEIQKRSIWKPFCPTLHQHFSHAKAFEKTLAVAKALNQNPWPQPKQSPLLFLLMSDLYLHDFKNNEKKIEKIQDDLKVSKAEREDMERIQRNLQRIAKDLHATEPGRILSKNPRYYPSVSQAFFVLRVLADAGIDNYSEVWKHWQKHWKKHLSESIRAAESMTGQKSGHRNQGRPGSSGRGRRRRRGPRRASTGGSGSSSSS